MERQVVVVIGAGGMGAAIARRIGAGRTVVLADRDPGMLDLLAISMRDEGFDVAVEEVDVAVAASVGDLASAAAERGSVIALAHTAGVSPVQSTVADIVAVDLLGTAQVIDAFGAHIAHGGAAVVIASMAGTLLGPSVSASTQQVLAVAPTAELLQTPAVRALLEGPDRPDTRATAYGLAKRANQLRVQAAAPKWGMRRARINSISPGVIATAMGRAELEGGPAGERIAAMVANSPVGRLGTATDIAAVADFLLSPAAGFISGSDLLVDGGVVSSMVHPHSQASESGEAVSRT